MHANRRTSAPFIAVTIGIGEHYEHLASHSAKTCSDSTGLPVHIIREDAQVRYSPARIDLLRLELFDEFPDAETILYFDANTIFRRPVDVAGFSGLRELVCVRDLWDKPWVIGEARDIRIKPKEYFNPGVLVLNRQYHCEMLRRAKQLVKRWLPAEWAGQNALNAARAEMGIPMRHLDKNYNFLRFEEAAKPEAVVIGHIGGIAKWPKDIVSRYYQFWTRRSLVNSEPDSVAVQAMVGRHLYTRIGYDRRYIEFLPGGIIGNGAAECEMQWDISVNCGEPLLWMIGATGQPMCSFRNVADGRWRGRWMRYEQMQAELLNAALIDSLEEKSA